MLMQRLANLFRSPSCRNFGEIPAQNEILIASFRWFLSNRQIAKQGVKLISPVNRIVVLQGR